MSVSKFYKELVASDSFAQYSLRSTFFVRRLRELRLVEAIEEVRKLSDVSGGFSWGRPNELGIDKTAWDQIATLGIQPLRVFLHPRVLEEQPQLLLYYRTVASLSQKGLKKILGNDVVSIEQGKTKTIAPDRVLQIAITINAVMSGVVKTAAELKDSLLPGFQFAAVETQIQGSWNNAIGAEGERAVKTLLVNHLRAEIAQVVFRKGNSVTYSPDAHTRVIEQLDSVSVVRLQSGFHIRFSNEPDISLRDQENRPVIAIEVKAGHDTAGALERLGAGMKSFDNDRNINPRVKTVFVVRTMTPEVERRIRQGGSVDHTFGLTELLAGGKAQSTFANLIVRTMLSR